MLENLYEYATERQREILDAVIKEGSNNKASKKLEIARQTVDIGMLEA